MEIGSKRRRPEPSREMMFKEDDLRDRLGRSFVAVPASMRAKAGFSFEIWLPIGRFLKCSTIESAGLRGFITFPTKWRPRWKAEEKGMGARPDGLRRQTHDLGP